jgi:hypothetical protein
MGGGSVSSRFSASRSAVDDGRASEVDETTYCSQAPPEKRALDVSRGFFFGCEVSPNQLDYQQQSFRFTPE